MPEPQHTGGRRTPGGIPLERWAGWSLEHQARECRRMAECCREVRPDLSDQWEQAAEWCEGQKDETEAESKER